MLVAGNAGHCPGLDPGTSGARTVEAELAKIYTEKVNAYLEAAGVSTLFIQENELQDICDIANNKGADLFYSLHFNGAENPSAKGTEVFAFEGAERSKKFAQYVQDQLVSTLGTVDRGVKFSSGLYVLKHTYMTAILIEVGFLTNPEEEDLLNNKIDEACAAIARGITDFISSRETKPPTVTYTAKYFTAEETACHCGCGYNNVDTKLLRLLDEMREKLGPLSLNCCARCASHNAEVGGVRNSQHTVGPVTAADIDASVYGVDNVASVAEELGADGIGRYYGNAGNFVHVDVREGRCGAGYKWDEY